MWRLEVWEHSISLNDEWDECKGQTRNFRENYSGLAQTSRQAKAAKGKVLWWNCDLKCEDGHPTSAGHKSSETRHSSIRVRVRLDSSALQEAYNYMDMQWQEWENLLNVMFVVLLWRSERSVYRDVNQQMTCSQLIFQAWWKIKCCLYN
jgi:hypothetical protein